MIWIGRTFMVLAVILTAWIVVLAVTLPNRGVLANQTVVWVGFDLGLLVGMVATAWAALRRNRFLSVAAAATAALLLMDAWFDVVGSSSRMDRAQAVIMAVLVELPLSGFCWWIAVHAQSVAERRMADVVLGRLAQTGEQAEAQPEDQARDRIT